MGAVLFVPGPSPVGAMRESGSSVVRRRHGALTGELYQVWMEGQQLEAG